MGNSRRLAPTHTCHGGQRTPRGRRASGAPCFSRVRPPAQRGARRSAVRRSIIGMLTPAKSVVIASGPTTVHHQPASAASPNSHTPHPQADLPQVVGVAVQAPEPDVDQAPGVGGVGGEAMALEVGDRLDGHRAGGDDERERVEDAEPVRAVRHGRPDGEHPAEDEQGREQLDPAEVDDPPRHAPAHRRVAQPHVAPVLVPEPRATCGSSCPSDGSPTRAISATTTARRAGAPPPWVAHATAITGGARSSTGRTRSRLSTAIDAAKTTTVAAKSAASAITMGCGIAAEQGGGRPCEAARRRVGRGDEREPASPRAQGVAGCWVHGVVVGAAVAEPHRPGHRPAALETTAR